MAKRFIDTNFFKHPFVRNLEAPLKALYCFIICDCDVAGFWSPDFEIAQIYTGQKFTREDFEKAFNGKYVKIENGEYFFPDFIQRQYEGKLKESNPAHKNVLKKLSDHGFIDSFFTKDQDEKGIEFYQLNKAALEGLSSSFKATKDKEKDKDKEMVKEKDAREKFELKVLDFQKQVFDYGSIKSIPVNIIEDFFNYWSEPTTSGAKKMRWETMKTFSVPGRFSTWMKKEKEYRYKPGEKLTRQEQILKSIEENELSRQTGTYAD